MNAVSFCLYGDKPKYCEGMIVNAWLMPKVYPGWECHCWIGDDVPLTIADRLLDLGCVLHTMSRGYKQRMFYRLLIHDEPNVERYLIRDADSRIMPREAKCVREWMNTCAVLHCIHDHFYHQQPIQGGMFGVWRKECGVMNMAHLIGDWPNNDRWGQDEDFLRTVIWPLLQHNYLEHGRTRPIPPAGPGEDPDAFIGEIRDEHEGFIKEHRAMPRK